MPTFDDNYPETEIPAYSIKASAAGGGDGSDGGEVCKIDSIFENWAKERLSALKELIPSIKTVYQWNILKNGKQASIWTCDFKNGEGAIHRGTPKTGRADCILTIDDDLVCKIFEGSEDAMKVMN